MILKIRTKDKLEELIRHRNSPSWVIAEARETQIKKVEIYQFDGKRVLKGDFDLIRSSRTEDGRLIVAFTNAVIDNSNYEWLGQNPIKYEEPNCSFEKVTREEIEKEIANGVYFDRRLEIAKIIFNELNDVIWAEQLIADSYTDYNDLEEGINALKFLYHDLNKKEIVIDLIKNDFERVSKSIYETNLYSSFIINDLHDEDWAVEIMKIGIDQIRSNNTNDLPNSVEEYDSKVDETNEQNSFSLVLRVDIKGFELSDYALLNSDDLGMLDIKSSIENYFPSDEIYYQLISATAAEVALEEECIHVLWCIIDIENQDPNEYIPNNQDIFLEISAELETRISCFIVPKIDITTFDKSSLHFENILIASEEKYMSYLEGDFDSGFYL